MASEQETHGSPFDHPDSEHSHAEHSHAEHSHPEHTHPEPPAPEPSLIDAPPSSEAPLVDVESPAETPTEPPAVQKMTIQQEVVKRKAEKGTGYACLFVCCCCFVCPGKLEFILDHLCCKSCTS